MYRCMVIDLYASFSRIYFHLLTKLADLIGTLLPAHFTQCKFGGKGKIKSTCLADHESCIVTPNAFDIGYCPRTIVPLHSLNELLSLINRRQTNIRQCNLMNVSSCASLFKCPPEQLMPTENSTMHPGI